MKIKKTNIVNAVEEMRFNKSKEENTSNYKDSKEQFAKVLKKQLDQINKK